MSNQKDVFNGAKQFANSQLSLKGGARLYLDGLGLKANAKTAVQAKKQVTDAMADKAVKANTEKGIYSSYSDSKPSKLELALIGGNYVDVSDKAGVEPTLTMTVKDCLAMATPVYANLDKEKAKVNIYGKAGVSLKAFVKPIREAGQGFKRQVISRLTSEVVKCHMKACGLSVETDTSEQAVIKSIKASVKTISTKLEALKDLKAIEILNSLPSKYLS